MANAQSGSGDVATATAHVLDAQEQLLLHRITQGDHGAFWQLWNIHLDELQSRHSLQWMRGNLADAEDALSGSSVKACQYFLDAPRETINVKGWFTRLLHNHCIDMWKTRQRHDRYLQDVFTLNYLKAGQQTEPSAQTSVEDILLQQEMVVHIQNALNKLPSRLREPSLLRFVHEMSYEDIAAQLHLRADNVRKL